MPRIHLNLVLRHAAAVAAIACVGACASSRVEPIISYLYTLPEEPPATYYNNFVFVYKEAAIYPEELRGAGIEGTVLIEAHVRMDGRVLDSWVIHSVHPQLDEEALRATRGCVFERRENLGGPMNDAVLISYIFERY